MITYAAAWYLFSILFVLLASLTDDLVALILSFLSHFHFGNQIVTYIYDGLLHGRITILPGRTFDIVAIKIADGRDIAVSRSLSRSALASGPFQSVADMVFLLRDRASSKTNSARYLLLANRTRQLCIQGIERRFQLRVSLTAVYRFYIYRTYMYRI